MLAYFTGVELDGRPQPSVATTIPAILCNGHAVARVRSTAMLGIGGHDNLYPARLLSRRCGSRGPGHSGWPDS